MSHIPFSDVTGMTTLSHFVKLLFQRFEETIEISLSAHTHNDTISFYNDSQGNPMFLELTSPSLTTFTGIFPSFRVYEMGESGQVFDFTQWRMNIDVLNILASQGNYAFAFEKKYTFSREYQVDLKDKNKKEELRALSHRLNEERAFLEKYAKNYLTLYNLDLPESDLLSKLEEIRCLMKDEVDEIERCVFERGANFPDYFGTVAYRWAFERKLWFEPVA